MDVKADSEQVPVSSATSGRELRRKRDTLRVGGVPDHRMTIIGHGVRWAERIGPAAAAGAAALAGAVLGAVVGLVLWATGFMSIGTGAIPVAALGGAAAGALLGLAAHRMTSGRGGIPDTARVEVERFDLLVERERAERAQEVLERYGRS